MVWPLHTLRTFGGQNHGRNRHDNLLQNLFHRSIADDMTEYEQGALDYAIAWSLSEDDQKEQTLIDEFAHLMKEEKIIKAQVEEDEQIAKALQESLVMVSSPTNDYKCTSKAYPFHGATAPRICAGCNTEISGTGNILDFNGIVWHAKCLLCHACRKLITDDELCMSENHSYHISCHKKMTHPRCDVCNNFIPNSNDVVEYGEHPFWAQKYCPSHEHDGTSKCCSCERLESKGDKHAPLKDGRKLCRECSSFVIMDTDACQPLFLEIQEFFESLDMKVDQQIPLLLVEREALNEAMEGEKNGHHHLPETRGLCLSEGQTIPIIQRRPEKGKGHRIFDMLIQPRRLVRNYEVTAILVLYGLPRLLTGSILAHEMMHAWLRLNGYPNLELEIEEGICQVIAHMWLKSEINYRSGGDIASSSSSSSLRGRRSNKRKLTETERKLGECFIRQIELDASLAYGDGFRVGQQAVYQLGLRATLDHIKLARTFPISTLNL